MQTDCVMQLANQHYFSPTLYRVKLCVRVQQKVFQSTLNDINADAALD
jgi:hypothetical protein